jgi:hypothetical protein
MITIILTTTINVQKKFNNAINKQDRICTYVKSIKKWLLNTSFNIIVVENTGYDYPELLEEKNIYKNRFEIISYNEIDIPEANYLINIHSKGANEMFSINYAYNNSKIVNNSIFIIKITGRYFIPDFEKYISNFNLNEYNCLSQNNLERCEMVGSHIKNFNIIFNKDLKDKNGNFQSHVENVYRYRIISISKNLKCRIFDIESTQRGSVSKLYDTI